MSHSRRRRLDVIAPLLSLPLSHKCVNRFQSARSRHLLMSVGVAMASFFLLVPLVHVAGQAPQPRGGDSGNVTPQPPGLPTNPFSGLNPTPIIGQFPTPTPVRAATTAPQIATPTSVGAAASTSRGRVPATGLLKGTFSSFTAGNLTFTVMIDGVAQEIDQAVGPILTVGDFRSPPTGWTITAAATQFSTGGETPSTLAEDALSVTSMSSVCAPGQGQCDGAASNEIAYGLPKALASADDGSTGSAVTIFATTGGTGSYRITPNFHLHIAPEDKAGSYYATITIVYAAT